MASKFIIDENGNKIRVDKNGNKVNLPEHMLGQMKNPEVQAKAQATKRKKEEIARRQREVLESGFGRSKISDPNVQAELLDQLTDKALQGEEWALKLLIAQGAFKMDPEKASPPAEKKEVEIPVDDSINFIKQYQKKQEE